MRVLQQCAAAWIAAPRGADQRNKFALGYGERDVLECKPSVGGKALQVS